ncbi:MAG: transglycosylase SLT domain-containing protein [Pyrinomonadaceae bacterium]
MSSQIFLLRSLTICLTLIGLAVVAGAQVADDAGLYAVRRSDRTAREAGAFAQLPAAEHMRRANVYMPNRAFTEAREHWQAVIANGASEANVPAALFGTGRSYFQEQRYEEALRFFERVAREYPQTKDGREGLNSFAATLLRLGRPTEAAARYAEYIERYPDAERIESAHLNVIDSFREADRTREAMAWIESTRERFTGSATDKNALFAELRLHVAASEWRQAAQTADQLLSRPFQSGVLTTPDEVGYLRGYSLERSGHTEDAIRSYLALPPGSYYGRLATEKLSAMTNGTARSRAMQRAADARTQTATTASLYPALYRESILRFAKSRALDPRLVLAVMKEESRFRPRAKSLSAARGLLQLTLDTAARYATRAHVSHLTENQLYDPDVSIAIGSAYLAQLSQLFPNLPEAVAASYNGGEDNVARWLKRAKQSDPGVFVAEVGFAETKNYVFKVITSYRAYQQLYTADLKRR